MKTMKQLHETFIHSANKDVFASERKLPINTTSDGLSLAPTTKWLTIGSEHKRLEKLFVFRLIEQRNRFVIGVLEQEVETQHFAHVTIDALNVRLALMTATIGVVTELDREHAKFYDELHREVVYSCLT